MVVCKMRLRVKNALLHKLVFVQPPYTLYSLVFLLTVLSTTCPAFLSIRRFTVVPAHQQCIKEYQRLYPCCISYLTRMTVAFLLLVFSVVFLKTNSSLMLLVPTWRVTIVDLEKNRKGLCVTVIGL